MKPKPINSKLYARVKAEAKKKFNVYPSAYANGWLVKEYKRRGGKYSGKKSKKVGLGRWFDEKWINVCKLPKKVPCGRPKIALSEWKKKYPYCRPSRRINKKSPSTSNEIPLSVLKKRCKIKQKNPLKRIGGGKSRRKKSVRRKSRRRKSVRRKSRRKKSVRRKSRRRKSVRRKSRRKSVRRKSRRKSVRRKSRRKSVRRKSRRRKSVRRKSRRRKSVRRKSRRRKSVRRKSRGGSDPETKAPNYCELLLNLSKLPGDDGERAKEKLKIYCKNYKITI